jgi:transcription-repair coupling factor (superfamily II helicase)
MVTPNEKQLTIGAEKRLKVLQSLDSLGAGFQLASHDLDIRGGGNLLGDEQSGHIKEIGVELYQQMLEDAVNELKAGGAEVAADARGLVAADQRGRRGAHPRDVRAGPGRAAVAVPPPVGREKRRTGRRGRGADHRFGPLPDEANPAAEGSGDSRGCAEGATSARNFCFFSKKNPFLGPRARS